jgi:hypothetical protein
LGFPPEAAAAFRADFAAAEEVYVRPGQGLPPYLRELLSNLWIGRTAAEDKPDGMYYSCVLPLHAAEEAPFRAIAAGLDHVYFVNKVKDIGSELDAPTKTMLTIFLAAYILIALLVKMFYSWKQTFHICAVPFLLVLVTVLALADMALGFFSVTGLVLVALSFGALVLSGFIPVHIFGLSVFTGLSTAFISAMPPERKRIGEPAYQGRLAGAAFLRHSQHVNTRSPMSMTRQKTFGQKNRGYLRQDYRKRICPLPQTPAPPGAPQPFSRHKNLRRLRPVLLPPQG